MRVLHVSHDVLPDIRVEKEAVSLSKIGVELFFAGRFVKSTSFSSKFFVKTYSLPFDRRGNLGLRPWWSRLRRAFARVLEDCRPDFIHAHNLIAAKLALDLEAPFVYDDHEYWSKSCRYRIGLNPLHFYRWLVWRSWEEEVLRKALAVITVSEEIAEEHRRFNPRTVVLPNLPVKMEVEGLRKPLNGRRRLSSVYVGSLSTPQSPYRDTRGFLELFTGRDLGDLIVVGDESLESKPPIYSLGFLRHDLMMKELTKYHIGIIPWKRHPFHRYCNPNKAYEYAHAGLLVITVEDILPVINALRPYCETFRDYEELASSLRHYRDNLDEVYEKGLKTMEYARKKLIWEVYEKSLLKIYERFCP